MGVLSDVLLTPGSARTRPEHRRLIAVPRKPKGGVTESSGLEWLGSDHEVCRAARHGAPRLGDAVLLL